MINNIAYGGFVISKNVLAGNQYVIAIGKKVF